MVDVILLIAVLVEVAFASYCIATRSNQGRVRNYLRVGALAAFVLLALAFVIQWGLRWYGLALLLLIWAILGVVGLVRNQESGREFQTGAAVRQAVGTLLLVFLVSIPALIFPQYQLPKPTGSHQVATVTYTYIDPSRVDTFSKTGENRAVTVEFWYPQAASGKYPLVVFSHGSFGTRTSNTSTFLNLASNGYVVCSIDHPHQSLLARGANGRMVTIDPGFVQSVVNANAGKYDEVTDFQLETEWMKPRIADIHFVLNTVLADARGASSDPVYQIIDTEKIGLIGHSLGAESAAQVARERNDVKAVVNLDADLHGEYVDSGNGQYVPNQQLYPVPILTILSDTLVRLIDAVPNANTVIAVKHVTATAPDAYEIDLPGTDHMSMTDVPLMSPFLVWVINSSVPKAGGVEVDPYATLQTMNQDVLVFFNVYLKGQGTFSPQ
ncbi:MAG TPA: hypothetical protein VMT46_13215 [Anaerolineaceae bacterium]|nr:hypothetical protein [Anaerolineaceae bacterium]